MRIFKKSLLSNRGVRQQNYQVLRQTNKPAVLLELGYISNPTDEKMIRNQYRQTGRRSGCRWIKTIFCFIILANFSKIGIIISELYK